MKLSIFDESKYWGVLVDAQNAEKLKEYLASKSGTSVGSNPEHYGFGTGEIVLRVTKENILREKLEGWLNDFQP